ncbi:hypothetical protein ACFVH6_07250 [Spirillospora sp. NPDC127200]
MRSWSDDNPKAQLMQRKRTAKDDLFTAVMQDACPAPAPESPPEGAEHPDLPWSTEPPQVALHGVRESAGDEFADRARTATDQLMALLRSGVV